MLTGVSKADGLHPTLIFPDGTRGDPTRIQAHVYRAGMLVQLQVRIGDNGYYAVVHEGDDSLVHIELFPPEHQMFVLKHIFSEEDVTVTIPEAE